MDDSWTSFCFENHSSNQNSRNDNHAELRASNDPKEQQRPCRRQEHSPRIAAAMNNGHDLGGATISTTAAGVTLAGAETKVVGRLRITVVAILTGVSTTICFVAYLWARQAEVDAFRRDFTNLGTKFALSFQFQAKQRLAMLEGFTVDFTSHANSLHLQWPFVTLPDYHYRAGLLARNAGLTSVGFLTIVPEDQRQAYVQFLNNDTSQQEGFALQLSQPIDSVAPIPPFPDIVKFTPYGVLIDNTTIGPMMVTTQIFPSRNSTWRGINLMADPEFHHVLLSLMELGHYVVLDSADYIDPASRTHPKYQILTDNIKWSSFGKDSGIYYQNDPAAPVFYPVFDKLGYDKDKVVVGAVLGGIYWRTYLNGILPPGANDVLVILKNDCNQTFTYRLDGIDSTFVGKGDLHDSKYDALASPMALFRGYNNETIPELESCSYSVQAFPSQAFEDVYMTAAPLNYALSLAAAFVFTSIVFLLYDYAVEKRQRVVLRSALQSGAIVTSLFPEQVRDRLYQEQERYNNKHLHHHDDTKKLTNRRDSEKYLLPQDESTETAAIASSYPNCSVCFMDIAGFTNWSSSRSPTQVFDLLESTYGAFDIIARKRNVFKVETIGDCYVAVTGLPEVQPDHGVMIVKFTSDCLQAFQKLVQADSDIVNRLGLDTRDLSLRIGIHSGEVVAGVLRGEKSRFQIFGDTVNVAARCESLGQPNRIHVSQATAQILQESGKGGWLSQRMDPVEAKGKGILQTFWVNVGVGTSAKSTASLVSQVSSSVMPAPLDESVDI